MSCIYHHKYILYDFDELIFFEVPPVQQAQRSLGILNLLCDSVYLVLKLASSALNIKWNFVVHRYFVRCLNFPGYGCYIRRL